MFRLFILGIGLFAFWLLLSGKFTPLLLSFGVFSVAFSVWISWRLKLPGKISHPFEHLGKLMLFWLRLLGKVVVSNIDVSLRILGIKPVTPRVIALPLQTMDQLDTVIYANAITLTPGSASLHIKDNMLVVHTISKEGADALLNGDMRSIMPALAGTKHK